MLQAPGFACVSQWRWEQERKLVSANSVRSEKGRMSEEQVLGFVQHFERLTTACLQKLPAQVHHLFVLNEERGISSYRRQKEIPT